MSTITRGVRKVSENILSDGRAIIVTEKDKNKYKWSDIPVGSKFIDSKTGIEWVKLEGESDWVPAHAKNDGTLCIAKDTIIMSETFIIVNPKADANGMFEYVNAEGEHRHMPITTMSDGSTGYIFELEKGTYEMWRNHLSIVVDDVLHRDERSGGVEELTPSRFVLGEKLEAGHKITANYYRVIRIGNPYPRFFVNDQVPEDAEYGDYWLDYDATMQEYDVLTENGPSNTTTVSYKKVTGKPTTIKGYGITDKVVSENHVHTPEDFIDWPKDSNNECMPLKLKISHGDVDTIKNYTVGSTPGCIAYIGADGKISPNLLNITMIDGTMFYISKDQPSHPKDKSIWVDFTNMVFKYNRNGTWDTFGTVFRNT